LRNASGFLFAGCANSVRPNGAWSRKQPLSSHPAARRQTPPAIRSLFAGAFLCLLALQTWTLARTLVRPEEILDLFYGHRFVLGAIGRVLILLVCWIAFFHTERKGTRVVALSVSVAILLYWIVMLLNQGVLSTFPLPYTLGYPLIAAVFALYGVSAVER